jgi:hypothetical protein
MRWKGFAMTMEGERSHRKSTSSSVGLRRVRDRRHGISSIAMAEIYLVDWSASLVAAATSIFNIAGKAGLIDWPALPSGGAA